MEIRIDGDESLVSPAAGATLGAVVDGVQAIVSKLGRVVREMRLDGALATSEMLESGKARLATEFARLDVSTIALRALVHDGLAEARAIVSRLGESIASAAARFQAGNAGEGAALLRDIIEAVSAIRDAIAAATRFAPEQARAEKGIATALDRLAGTLRGLSRALGDRDFVTVGDLLELELGPSLPDLGSLLDRLVSATAVAGGPSA